MWTVIGAVIAALGGVLTALIGRDPVKRIRQEVELLKALEALPKEMDGRKDLEATINLRLDRYRKSREGRSQTAIMIGVLMMLCALLAVLIVAFNQDGHPSPQVQIISLVIALFVGVFSWALVHRIFD